VTSYHLFLPSTCDQHTVSTSYLPFGDSSEIHPSLTVRQAGDGSGRARGQIPGPGRLALRDIEDIRVRQGRKATEAEWGKSVHRHVRFEGHYRYDGLDFQDLNALFAIIQMQAIK